MAWALMESKIHNPRSRKAARALLRRAVALNPKRHSSILKWRVFMDWKEAGEAAVEAVRSALSSGEAAVSASSVASPPSPTAAASAAAAATSSTLGGDTDSLQRQGVSASERRSSSHGQSSSMAEAVAGVAENVDVSSQSLSWTRVAESADSRRSRIRSEAKERGLATDLLALCKTMGDDFTAEHEASAALGIGKVTREKVMAKHQVRFEELAGELEKTGKGLAGGDGAAGERELGGSWRLVFTTCTTCDRILLRAGMPPPAPPRAFGAALVCYFQRLFPCYLCLYCG